MSSGSMNPIDYIFGPVNLFNIIVPLHLLGGLGVRAILSLVFKENKFYRLFEHIFLGLAAGYSLQVNLTDVIRSQWWDPMWRDGQWGWVFVLPLSMMFYGIYTRQFAWQARLLFGLIFGMVTGTVFKAFSGQYIPQVSASFKPILPAHDGHLDFHKASVVPALNNIIFLVIMLCVASYFFFAFEQRNKLIQGSARAGRLLLMIAFGAIFGSTIMTREALLIDRVYYLLHDWLGVLK